MKVLNFDAAKKRPRAKEAHQDGEMGRLLSLACLSEGVIKRVVIRQAQRELEQLHYAYKVTCGYPEILPTPDQMRAFYEEGMEY